MADTFVIRINGVDCNVDYDTSVAAAVLNSGESRFRQSVNGVSRGPVCGMGICFECRLRINGREHQRSCMVLCEEGMVIETDA